MRVTARRLFDLTMPGSFYVCGIWHSSLGFWLGGALSFYYGWRLYDLHKAEATP